VFVEQINSLPQQILDQAQDGDVLLCMGAGSIGAVAAKVMALADGQERVAPQGSAV